MIPSGKPISKPLNMSDLVPFLLSLISVVVLKASLKGREDKECHARFRRCDS